jgi:hypothetical protein
LKKQRISFEEAMIRPSPPETSQRKTPTFTAASAGAGAASAEKTAAAIAIVRLWNLIWRSSLGDGAHFRRTAARLVADQINHIPAAIAAPTARTTTARRS